MAFPIGYAVLLLAILLQIGSAEGRAFQLGSFSIFNKCLRGPESPLELETIITGPLQMVDCNQDDRYQLWYRYSNGPVHVHSEQAQKEYGTEMFQNVGSRSCIERSLPGEGIPSSLILNSCDPAIGAQAWYVSATKARLDGETDIWVKSITPSGTQLCLGHNSGDQPSFADCNENLGFDREFPRFRDRWLPKLVAKEKSGPGPSALGLGEYLRVGQSISSMGGRFLLTFREDRQLVFIDRWASNTVYYNSVQEPRANLTIFTWDGSLSFAEASVRNGETYMLFLASVTRPVSVTPNTRVVLQDDGDLVAYQSASLQSKYFSLQIVSGGTPMGSVLYPGEFLYYHQFLQSPSGRCLLKMQADGNLVLSCLDGDTGAQRPVWASRTGRGSTSCMFYEFDGDLSLYEDDSRTVRIWNLGPAFATGPSKALRLQVVDGDDTVNPSSGGGVVLYNQDRPDTVAYRLP